MFLSVLHDERKHTDVLLVIVFFLLTSIWMLEFKMKATGKYAI